MLDDIVVHDIAQGISVPISTTENRLLTPWARIASRLRAHPAGLALLISEQTFQEQACIRRNTLLREQRTYPLLDLSKRRRPQRKRLLNRRGPRPRYSNHGCPWIQKSANKATVMLGVELDKPVIAATSGWVVGGGFVLVQMADMCIASETTRFIYPEAKIGTTAGGVASVVARMPHKIAMEFLLVGDELSAECAYQIGFVNRVAPKGQHVALAQEMAAKIAGNAPLVVQALKKLAR